MNRFYFTQWNTNLFILKPWNFMNSFIISSEYYDFYIITNMSVFLIQSLFSSKLFIRTRNLNVLKANFRYDLFSCRLLKRLEYPSNMFLLRRELCNVHISWLYKDFFSIYTKHHPIFLMQIVSDYLKANELPTHFNLSHNNIIPIFKVLLRVINFS